MIEYLDCKAGSSVDRIVGNIKSKKCLTIYEDCMRI